MLVPNIYVAKKTCRALTGGFVNFWISQLVELLIPQASFDHKGDGQLNEAEFERAVISMALGLSDQEIREVRIFLQGTQSHVPVDMWLGWQSPLFRWQFIAEWMVHYPYIYIL